MLTTLRHGLVSSRGLFLVLSTFRQRMTIKRQQKVAERLRITPCRGYLG